MTNSEYFKTDEFLALLNEYEECEKNNIPHIHSSDEYADLAEYFQMKGKHEKAKAVAQQGNDIFPGATLPLVFLARQALCDEDDPAKALILANQITDKHDLDYYYIRAEIMIAQDDLDEADDYLNARMEEIDDVELMDYVYDVALLYTDYNLFDQAETWLNRYDEKESEEYLELYCQILFGRGHFAEGERVVNELLDSDPYRSLYWNILASAQLQQNRIQESIDSSEFSIAIDPNDEEAIMTKAHGLFALGNYEGALSYYERYNRLNETEESLILISVCLMSLNRWAEAVERLRHAEEIAQPDSPRLLEIYQEQAFALSQLGFVDKAMEAIDKTDLLDCDHDEMMVMRGHIHLQAGNLVEAQEYFERAISKAHTPSKIFLRIATSLYDNGFIPLAFKMLRMLMEVDIPDNYDGYAYFAMCCYHDHDRQNFLKYLSKAIDTNPMEAASVLANLFPEDVNVGEYYDYALAHEEEFK